MHRASVHVRTEFKLLLSQTVNALLIALDRLRRRPNIIVFSMSNFVKAVVRNFNSCTAPIIHVLLIGQDSAFLDRIDVK